MAMTGVASAVGYGGAVGGSASAAASSASTMIDNGIAAAASAVIAHFANEIALNTMAGGEETSVMGNNGKQAQRAANG